MQLQLPCLLFTLCTRAVASYRAAVQRGAGQTAETVPLNLPATSPADPSSVRLVGSEYVNLLSDWEELDVVPFKEFDGKRGKGGR